MPKRNITLDNPNPAILYSGTWLEGDPVLDSLGREYSNGGTFKITTENGATARLTFNGTAVWVYGARRPNHGDYSVTLDGAFVLQESGAGPDIISDVLYSASSLTPGPHTVEIKNIPKRNQPYLDVDYIIYETSVGTADETLDVAVVQNTAEQFSYTPSQAWTTSSEKLQSFNGSTGHLTEQNAASVFCNFTGDAISIFGSIGPNNGPYFVSLDGGSQVVYNASYKLYTPQVQLYEANNLGPGNHTLVLTNRPEVVGQSLAIDFAIITNTAATKETPAVQTTDIAEKSGLSTGAIAGIAVGVVLVVGLICALAFFLLRRRRKNNTSLDEKMVPSRLDTNPQPFAPHATAPFSPEVPLSSRQTFTSYYPASESAFSPTTSAATALQNPWSHASSDEGTSSSGTRSGGLHVRNTSLGSNPTTINGSGSAWAATSPTSTTQTYPNEKAPLSAQTTSLMGRMLPQPPVAASVSADLSGVVNEPGREMDAGPLLPPSYVQATQPRAPV